MTKEDVIKLGQEVVPFEKSNYFLSIHFVVAVIVILALFAVVIFGLRAIELLFNATSMVSIIIIFLSFITYVFSGDFAGNLKAHIAEKDEWKEEIAYPYIKSLPTSERELKTVILDTQKFNGNTYTDQLPLIISYQLNGKIVTTSAVYDIEERLEEGEKPFLEFRKLNDKLGHDVNPGSYFEKIILPKNFTLEPSSK